LLELDQSQRTATPHDDGGDDASSATNQSSDKAAHVPLSSLLK